MKATATEVGRRWSSSLAKVQQGITIEIVDSDQAGRLIRETIRNGKARPTLEDVSLARS